MSIRKQLSDIQIEDFTICDFWEFALDEENVEGQDETTIRPSPEWTIGAGSCVVRTTYKLACGDELQGFLIHDGAMTSISDNQNLTSVEKIKKYDPVVFAEGIQVSFFYGIKPSMQKIEEMKMCLSKIGRNIFPILFSARIPEGTNIDGTIDGFIYLEVTKKGLFSKKNNEYKFLK